MTFCGMKEFIYNTMFTLFLLCFFYGEGDVPYIPSTWIMPILMSLSITSSSSVNSNKVNYGKFSDLTLCD